MLNKCARSATFLLIIVVAASFIKPEPPRVFAVGDSTMCFYDVAANSKRYGGENYPIRGWMMYFSEFLQPDIRVINRAASGRSSKSFRQEGLWQKVTDSLRAGDYVFIQFGHNDEKTDTLRHTDAHSTFKTYLASYVNDARAKGAIPVLFTSIARRAFDSTTGKVQDTHGDYVTELKMLADSMHVPLVDMNAKTMALLQKTGPEASKKLYLYFPAGAYTFFPEGLKDDTHLCEAGARAYAGLAAEGIKELKLGLAKNMK